MTMIPPDEVTLKDVYRWFELKEEAAKKVAEERLLRQRIFKHYFPTPKEGTNKAELNDGFGSVLVATYPIDRKPDQAQLDALKTTTVGEMREQLTVLGIPCVDIANDVKVLDFLKINTDKLLRYKPELAVREYRTLTAEQAKIFDRILDVKPGSISVEIKPGAEAVKAAEIAAAPKAPDDIRQTPDGPNVQYEVPVFTAKKAPF